MLQVGDVAPHFSLPDQSLKTIELAALKGKKVILYFYPKDMTPGCTKEACNFRDSYAALQGLDVEVLGVSKDTPSRHRSFAGLYQLPFSLLSDEDGSVCRAYGVLAEKSFFGHKYLGVMRATFLIDGQGVIAQAWPDVTVTGHVQEVVEAVKKLD